MVGVDLVPEAIETARARARSAGVAVQFLVGDVSRLRETGVAGAFDLLIDIGCYHAVPAALRGAYAAEVAAVACPGADLYLAGISRPPATWRLLGAQGLNGAELRSRFGAAFDVVEERAVGAMGRITRLTLFHLVRRGAGREGEST